MIITTEMRHTKPEQLGQSPSDRFASDDHRAKWRAVTTRDRDADGAFVYAVRSTGIYCRPSCPSRKPTRSRVAFFDTPRDAEREGFRPCRRCRPADVATVDS